MAETKKKQFEIALGARVPTPGVQDPVLSSKLVERKAADLDRAEELADLQHTAKVAELKKKIKSSDPAEGGSAGAKTAPGGVDFKVTGGVNLGNIDFAEERKRATEELKAQAEKNDRALESLAAQNESLKEELHKRDLDVVLDRYSELSKKLDAIDPRNSKGDFLQEITKIREYAKELGLGAPAAASGAGHDLMAEIRLKEIEFNNLIALKKFDEEAKDREAQRKIDLAKIDMEREDRKKDAERQAKRDEILPKALETIGKAIGAGIREGMPGISEEPEERVASKPKKPAMKMQAPEGESGVTDCPNCNSPMAIGPTSKKAICAECMTEYEVERVKVEPTKPAAAERPAAETQPPHQPQQEQTSSAENNTRPV